MEYIKKIIKINKVNIVAYLLIGFTNSFLLNYKIRIFQELIDDFINGEILLAAILFYGFICKFLIQEIYPCNWCTV